MAAAAAAAPVSLYPPQLTFGVEMEFAVRDVNRPTTATTMGPNNPGDVQQDNLQALVEQVHNEIVQLLRDSGFAAVRVPFDGHLDTYNEWQVAYDSTIDVEAEETRRGHCIMPVELITPVFRAENFLRAEWDPAFAAATPAPTEAEVTRGQMNDAGTLPPHLQIWRALAVIGARFPLLVNACCGVHVHVRCVDAGGNAASGPPAHWRAEDRAGWSMGTLRALAVLASAGEGLLNQLMPRRRQVNRWARTPSCARPPAWARAPPQQVLGRVWRARGVRALQQRLYRADAERNVAYNFWSLVMRAHPPAAGSAAAARPYPPTVEFRQYRGSVKADEIVVWVRVVLAMVALAHRHRGAGQAAGGGDDDAYWPLLVEALRGVHGKRRATAFDLLRGLGVDASAPLGRLLHMRLARPRRRLWLTLHKAYVPRPRRDLLPYVMENVAARIEAEAGQRL